MKFTAIALLLLICMGLQAQTSDEAVIKSVIQTSYVDGIQNGGSAAQIREGFDESFQMLRLIDNTVKPYPIEEWITAIETRKKENVPALPKAEAKFLSVDVTGNAAVVKLDLYRDNKRTFTDYLVLYKFNEGWKIVSKTYFRHP